MRRISVVALSFVLAHCTTLVAEPITIKGKKSVTWNDPSGGSSSGAGTDWLRFGEYNAASVGWSGNRRFTATEGSPFSLGVIYLTNGSSLNPPTHATMSVTLDIKKPTDEPPATFDFDAYLLSTNPSGGGDLKFSLVPGQTATWTSSEGKKYSLELLGLSNNWEWDGNTYSTLTAVADCDNNQSYAWIYARLSVDDPQLIANPEPGALVLAGMGLAFLALRRRLHRTAFAPS